MRFALGLLFCVALATGAVVDEFAAFKTKFNKVYRDEREVIFKLIILLVSIKCSYPFRVCFE